MRKKRCIRKYTEASRPIRDNQKNVAAQVFPFVVGTRGTISRIFFSASQDVIGNAHVPTLFRTAHTEESVVSLSFGYDLRYDPHHSVETLSQSGYQIIIVIIIIISPSRDNFTIFLF